MSQFKQAARRSTPFHSLFVALCSCSVDWLKPPRLKMATCLAQSICLDVPLIHIWGVLDPCPMLYVPTMFIYKLWITEVQWLMGHFQIKWGEKKSQVRWCDLQFQRCHIKMNVMLSSWSWIAGGLVGLTSYTLCFYKRRKERSKEKRKDLSRYRIPGRCYTRWNIGGWLALQSGQTIRSSWKRDWTGLQGLDHRRF